MCRNNRILKHLIPNACNGDINSKHAAGIYSGGKLISLGNNHMRNMNSGKFMLSVHAEQHAIINYLSKCNLHNLRGLINDEFTSCGGRDAKYCFLCEPKHSKKI
jgi:hypothetical protein